jgi:uncharacterized protein DUF1761
MSSFAHLPWLGIIVATVVSFMLGGLWFSPLLFANRWIAALGKTKEQLGKPGPALAGSFLATLITAIAVALIESKMPNLTIGGAVRLGLVIGVMIYAVGTASDYAFTNWPRTVYYIQAGYHVVTITLIATIIRAFS